MSGLEVVIKNSKNHPKCPHGPALLFSRLVDGVRRNFFACSACRDRKLCPFFLYEDEKNRKQPFWDEQNKKFVKNVNHRKLFLVLSEIKGLSVEERAYCHTCSRFQQKKFWGKHEEHDFVKNISDESLKYPSEFLPPLEDSKKEAQFMFSKSSVRVIVQILEQQNYKHVICIGTPRIHEFILDQCPHMSSILLDFDSRYHNFYGPLEFCWYNVFNNHFFLPEAREVFENFIQSSGELVLIMDPPFGGRTEPLAHTIKLIGEQYSQLNNKKLPIFWIFPYFMEPQILNSLPELAMLDYKVGYDNHPLFQDGPKGRKLGSPVRIFTNISLSKIKLPKDEGYKLCVKCQKYVSNENKHCEQCKKCTSKDGSTYTHCLKCKKCVKPSWQHCETCNKCAQKDHKCGLETPFTQDCFHCKKAGHKKRDCPEVDRIELHKKRKLKAGKKSKKPRLN